MEYSLSSAVYAALIAFVANIILCPILIPYLIKIKFGQNVRFDGPATHIKKAGTPTMGGIMIILSLLLASLLFLKGNTDAAVVLLATVGFGLVGFIDDFISIRKKRSLGLKAYQKMLLCGVIAAAFLAYCYAQPGFTTEIMVPFFPALYVDLGYFYVPLIVFIMLGTVNGANLTDGLDGLATGVTALIVSFFLFSAWAQDSVLMPVIGAAVGSLLGFLLFNAHPAKIFMGDTGSLALGGFVACVAVMLKMPLFLCIVALVYMVEALSVIIQVSYYKMTKRRFFKMAPIHHSFELSGWPETKVVAFFYVMTALMCLVGYLAAQHLF